MSIIPRLCLQELADGTMCGKPAAVQMRVYSPDGINDAAVTLCYVHAIEWMKWMLEPRPCDVDDRTT